MPTSIPERAAHEQRSSDRPGANGTYLYYDPAGRLDQLTQAGLTWEWDGPDLVTERSGASIVKRYVHGPGADEPVVAYENGVRRWLGADERGSIVRVTDDAAATVATNTYDEYGIPGAANSGRFQYTGQMWLSELGMYYYKARMYSPTLGRFLQTDPIGYADGLNWYDYVGGDPVNSTDPSGLQEREEFVVTGRYTDQQKCLRKGLIWVSEQGGGGTCITPGMMPPQTNTPPLAPGPGRLPALPVASAVPQKPPLRSKPYICRKLAARNYNAAAAHVDSYKERLQYVDGKRNWSNNPIMREGENWLTSAPGHFTLPFAFRFQIEAHHFLKKTPIGGTPPSEAAYQAGLDGLSHYGDSPSELKAWCDAK